VSDHHERNDAMDMAADRANDAEARAEMAMQLITAYGGIDGAHPETRGPSREPGAGPLRPRSGA